MKKLLIAVVMAVSAGAAYAGSAAEQLGLGDVKMQQLPVPAPSTLSDSFKIGADQIIYVPAHYGIIIYINGAGVDATFYKSPAGAAADMNKLLDALRRYGVKAEGSVQENYWHVWGFKITYSPGSIKKETGYKYSSIANAEKAALRIIAKLEKERRRPLVPVVKVEMSESGVETYYRAEALYYKD